MKSYFFKLLTAITTLLLIVGCGDENTITGSSVGTGGTGTGSYTLTAGTGTPIVVVGSTFDITASLLDDNQLPVEQAQVAFSIDNGAFTGNTKYITANTDANGRAVATVTAPVLVGTGTVTVTYGDLSATVNLDYIHSTPSRISLTASPSLVGVSSDSTLTTTLQDQYGNPIPNEAMQFGFTAQGSSTPILEGTGIVQTNANGVATIIYTAGTVAGVDTVSVSPLNGGSPSATADITVNASSASIASLTLQQELPSTSMKVGTSQKLTATVLDNTTAPVVGLTVAFEVVGSGDIAGAKLASAVTDTNGIATVTLNAPVLVGSATINASSSGLSKSITLTYDADVPASVVFTANPASVGALSDSTLTAKVYDQYGNVTPGEPVVFSFATNASGGVLTPSAGNATTDTTGVATLIYTSGSKAGTQDILQVDVTNGAAPSATTTIDVTSGAVPIASTMTVRTDTPTILSDGSTTATITVTLLDTVNAVVPGATVYFTSDGGVISSGQAVTDANGQASITLGAGTDPTNQTITVTAKSTGVTDVLIPVEVIGSTVTITPDQSSLILGGADTATLTIKAADASGVGVYNTPVYVSFDTTASTGTANLSIPGGGTTDTQGEWSVDLTGVTAGTVRVVATALGATTFHDFIVESVAGSLLITSPETGTTAPINTPTTVSIDVPSGITNITLVSSLGTWAGSNTNIRTWTGLTSPTTITDDLTSTSIGTASINVADTNNSAVNYNIRLLFVDQIVDGNSTVSLQASPTTIAPSVGSTLNSSVLYANVKNANNEPIAGAMVTFSMSNTTGSGEYIEPPVAYTDETGVATATFYSGSQSTDSTGLQVKADLWQTSDPTLLADSSSVSLIVGGTAGSIVMNVSTSISSINADTDYSLPISVKVADSAGNPVPNTVVNLSVWPQQYGLGYWVCDPEPGLVRDAELPNEDIDRDIVIDTGEDISGDGTLTPPLAAAGTIIAEVITNESGSAVFYLEYGKGSAGFIYDAITATALVQGTETRATKRFWLQASDSDVSGCNLGGSPLNEHWPNFTNTKVTPSSVIVGGQSVISTELYAPTAPTATPLAGKDVTATLISKGSGIPTLDADTSTSTLVTASDGSVSFVYTAGGTAGLDIVKLTYTAGAVTITDYVFIDVTP